MSEDIPMCDSPVKEGHCALHRLLWEHHDNDRREHRTELCDKILMLSNSITAMVPRWVFVLATAAGFAFSILLFGWVVTSITKGQETLAIGQKEIIVTMNNIENRQITVLEKQKVFEDEMEKLNRRQDFLRDQNVKILENQKK